VSLRLRVYTGLAAAVLLAAMVGAWAIGDLVAGAPRLVVEDRRTGRVFVDQPVVPGARLTLSHRSPLSGERVTGVFEVAADGGLMARDPGGPPPPPPDEPAAAPADAARRRSAAAPVGDLYVVVHPHTAHRLRVGARVVDLSATLPPGTHLRIAVRSP
jgi:hypothetical protein